MKTKDELPACPVATAVALIGGKWKLLILRNLKMRAWRFNELQRDLEGISQKVLTDSLRRGLSTDLQNSDGRCCRLLMHWLTLEIIINHISAKRNNLIEIIPPFLLSFFEQITYLREQFLLGGRLCFNLGRLFLCLEVVCKLYNHKY